MHTVNIVEDEEPKTSRPFRVKVDGLLLKNARGADRRFETSFAAGLAGAREIDRIRDRGKTFITEPR